MAYIYKHIRTDKNEVFYVGIGNDKKYQRAYDRRKRTQLWKNIINKTDYIIEIVEDGLTWEEACEGEVKWIKHYGRKDLNEGSLVNMTDGGDGCVGLIMKDDTKQKLSIANSGSNNGNYRKKYTEEERLKLSIAQKKRFEDPNERLKTNPFNNLTEEQLKERKKVWSDAQSGKNNSRFKWDKEVLQINPETNEIVARYEYPRLVEQDGFASKYVIACCNGERKYGKYKNYIWKFVEN
jgi:hypothetical protein